MAASVAWHVRMGVTMATVSGRVVTAARLGACPDSRSPMDSDDGRILRVVV